MHQPVIILAAFDTQRAIGRANQLPWNVKAEMAHFKKTTLNQTVLMGSVTARSLQRPLTARTNLVLTRTGKAPFPGQIAVDSIEKAIAHGTGPLYVIGGAQTYRDAMPYADRLIVSYIDLTISDADAWFPPIDTERFKQVSADVHLSNNDDEPHFSIWTFDRIDKD